MVLEGIGLGGTVRETGPEPKSLPAFGSADEGIGAAGPTAQSVKTQARPHSVGDRWMVRIAIAAALASLSLQPAPAAAPVVPDADPAIWVVNDRDTVIFLFGTFHALDGNSDWFNDEVETAFASADELVLETVVPDLGASARDPAGKAGRERARGLPVGPSASFLATTRMAMSAGRSKGMQVDKGADEVLRKAAHATGKAVGGLEAFEEQLAMFARLPSTPRPSNIVQSIQQMQRMTALMGWMQAAWNRGDDQAFASVIDQLRQSSPETYKTMFTERNANWAAWIAQRLEQPGTVFVAVGAGHLAGRDSVQAKLADLGVRSERLS